MMRVFIDSNGKVTHTLSGVHSLVEVNTPDDAVYVDTDEKDITPSFYFNGVSFVDVGLPLTPNHTFDYVIKEWVDLRTLDQIKAQKWAEIKSERDRIEFGGFEFDGDIYDSDQVSQGRILGASIAGVDQVWTLADNSTRSLSASQLQQLYAALQTHTALVHERGRIAREAIMSAITKEDVDAVTL